jgi:predicted enzyme related to lactoylglutathione lyase
MKTKTAYRKGNMPAPQFDFTGKEKEDTLAYDHSLEYISHYGPKIYSMETMGVMHMLLVQDMDRAIDFYEKTFGFITIQRSSFWSNLDCGHGKIALCSFGNKTERKETSLIIEVDDYKQAAENIAMNGGQVSQIAEPYEGAPVYNVVMIDTENNQLVASQMVHV